MLRREATCLDTDEPHIRTLILQAVAREALLLRSLESSDLGEPGRVRVRAELLTEGRADRAVEQIASRLNLEPGIAAVRWAVVREQPDE